MNYKIKLDLFEGPLDLLLYLIKKSDIEITDIPIAEITEQYMEYIEVMKMLDLDVVGDFLVMAATLMQIKSKMLLPPDPVELEQEEEDPRDNDDICEALNSIVRDIKTNLGDYPSLIQVINESESFENFVASVDDIGSVEEIEGG